MNETTQNGTVQNNMNQPPQQGYRNPYAGAPLPPQPAPGPQPPYMPMPPKKKETFPMEKRDLIFAGLAAGITLFGVIAGLWGGFRAGYTAAFALCFIAVSVYLGQKKQKPGIFGCVCGALSLALAPVFTVTSNPAIRLFSVIAMTALSIVWFAALAGRRTPEGDLGLLSTMLAPIPDAPGNLPQTLRGLFSGGDKQKRISKVLLGILCALPVLCVVIPLLMRSDLAFEGMLTGIFKDLAAIAGQIIVTVLLTPLVLSFVFSLRKTEKQPTRIKEGKGLDTAFIAAFLGVLSVAYLCYLFSQTAYFFDAFKGMLPEDYTFSYAEYARRGFFELCAVAAINLALILAAMLFSRKKEGRLPAAVKGLGAFLSLFTLVLIGTALAKMALYIKNYGMTVLRIGVSAFTVFMGAVFIAVLLRLFIKKIKVLETAAVAAALVLIALGLCNVNAVVAEYNYNAYITGKLNSIDALYLRELGPEGVPYLVKLMEDGKQPDKVRREATYAFYLTCANGLYESEWVDDKYKDPTEEWMTYYGYDFTTPLKRRAGKPSQFSLPLREAYAAADAFLKEHPDFLEKEDRIAAYHNDEWGYFDGEEATTEAATEPPTQIDPSLDPTAGAAEPATGK